MKISKKKDIKMVADGMNIWIINQYVRLPGQDGGMRHFQLARELVAKGHHVTLIASPVSYVTGKLDEGVSLGLEKRDGVHIYWVKSSAYSGHSIKRIWGMLAFSWRIWAADLVKHLKNPDVIVGSSPQLFATLSAERIAKKLDVPFVLEVRDLWPQTLIDVAGLSSYHPLIIIFSLIEKYCYRRAQRIISLLPAAASYIEQNGAKKGAVEWIPNGVDLNAFCIDEPPPGGARLIITYTGTHSFANSLDTVLDAIIQLSNDGYSEQFLFRFVGDGACKEQLKKRAYAEVPDMVEFLDAVPKEHVPSILAKTDVCIVVLKNIPLYRWGVSLNKLFDYLAASRPIIFSGDTACNPVADAGAGIVVPGEDALAIAVAARQLLSMSVLDRRKLGDAGRQYVEKFYALPHLAEEYERVLAKVVRK